MSICPRHLAFAGKSRNDAISRIADLLAIAVSLTTMAFADDSDVHRRVPDRVTHDSLAGDLFQLNRPLPDTLETLCRMFDAVTQGCASSLLVFDRTRTRVRHAIAPCMPCGHNEILVHGPLTCAVARAGANLDTSKPIIASNGEISGTFSIYRLDAHSPRRSQRL